MLFRNLWIKAPDCSSFKDDFSGIFWRCFWIAFLWPIDNSNHFLKSMSFKGEGGFTIVEAFFSSCRIFEGRTLPTCRFYLLSYRSKFKLPIEDEFFLLKIPIYCTFNVFISSSPPLFLAKIIALNWSTILLYSSFCLCKLRLACSNFDTVSACCWAATFLFTGFYLPTISYFDILSLLLVEMRSGYLFPIFLMMVAMNLVAA